MTQSIMYILLTTSVRNDLHIFIGGVCVTRNLINPECLLRLRLG